MSLVTCDRVGNDLTNWADDATPEEKDALCEALGCSDDDMAEVATQDTPSVELSGDGSDANPLKADVKLSAKADNCLTIEDDGLHVTCPGGSGMAEVVTEDTSTVRMTGDGSTADPLKSDAKISTEAGNQLSIRGDGLFVPAGNGPEGPAGPQGPAGPAGADGAEGPAGPAGPAGADGAEGPQGPAGADGKDGKDGAEGPMGPQGPQGLQGPQGPMGPMGPQGPQGPAGGGGGGGDVEISPDENNCLQMRGNGLYVPCPEESCGTPEDFIFDVINDDGTAASWSSSIISQMWIASTAPMAQFRLEGLSWMYEPDLLLNPDIKNETYYWFGYPAEYSYPLKTEEPGEYAHIRPYRNGRYHVTPQKGSTVALYSQYEGNIQT